MNGLQGDADDIADGLEGVSDLVPVVVDEETPNRPLTPINGPNAIGFVTLRTPIDTDEVIIDIAAPQGFVFIDNDGNRQRITREFHIRYRDVLTGVSSASPDTVVSVAAQSYSPPAGRAAQTYTGGGFAPSRFNRAAVNTSGIIFIDQSSGKLGAVRNRTVQFNPFIGQQPGTVSAKVPDNKIEIARWSRGTGAPTITDTRTTSSTAGLFNSFANPTDFIPTVNGNNIDVAAGQLNRTFTITGATEQVLRKSFRFRLPARGQYDFSVRQFTANEGSLQVRDDCVWTKFRSITKNQPVNQPGLASLAMRIKATGQLNGVVSQFNCIATSMVPWWSGSTWVAEQATQNPAALVLQVLTGPSNPKRLRGASSVLQPDGGDLYNQTNITNDLNEVDGEHPFIDVASFEEWFEFCEGGQSAVANSPPFEFNQYVDYSTSVDELVSTIASAGRARVITLSGKRTAIFDGVKTDPADVRQHFNQQNSSNFRSTKVFSDDLHAWRIRFANEQKNFLQDEMFVYADGFGLVADPGNNILAADPRFIETLELPGITNPDLIFLHGRYFHAVRLLRPEIYQIDTDSEYLNIRPGDLVRVTHDTPRFGLGSFRILAVNVSGPNAVSIDINGTAVMEDVGTVPDGYTVRIRNDSGSSIIAPVDRVVGNNTTLTFTTPFASSLIQIENIVMFGVTGSESAPLLVKDIITKRDLTATIELADLADAVNGDLTQPIPAFNSLVTVIENLEVPAINEIFDDDGNAIEAIISDARVMTRNEDGSLQAAIYIELGPPSNRPLHRIDVLVVSIRDAGTDDQFREVLIARNDASSITIQPVDELNTYEVRLQFRFKDGELGAPLCRTVFVVGKVAAPPAPDLFDAKGLPDGTRQYEALTNIPDLDLAGYRVFAARLKTGEFCSDKIFPSDYQDLFTMPVFATAGNPARAVQESNELEAGRYAFACVSEDTGGRQSSEICIERTLGDQRLGDVFFVRSAAFNDWAFGGSMNYIEDSASVNTTNEFFFPVGDPPQVLDQQVVGPFDTGFATSAFSVTEGDAASGDANQGIAWSTIRDGSGSGGEWADDHVHIFSCWFRPTLTSRRFAYFALGSGDSTEIAAFFDLDNGVVSSTRDDTATHEVKAVMESGPDGWTRCSIIFVPGFFGFYEDIYFGGANADDDASFVGDGRVNIEFFGPQIEFYPTSERSFASVDGPRTYIPTFDTEVLPEPGAALTDALINSQNQIVPDDNNTWTTLVDFDNGNATWRRSSVGTMIFEDAVIDATSFFPTPAIVNYVPGGLATSFGGTVIIEFRSGTSEANCLAATYANISGHANVPVANVFIQFRVRVISPAVRGLFSLTEFLSPA